ncbi:MAG TPA: ELWxxDGT repeat protein, partial [Candidatus Polarisedimenticolaceae bacterium]|nr:ELWxxDGT repeat protein [Candidatus Polarisedimenticolaceae bacterium]
KDLWPGGSGSSPLFFTAVGARVVFTAFDGVGQGLWATDGTASGTHLLGNIALLGGDSDFVPFEDALYFVASQVGSGRSLWRTDGTESGTFPVADVGTGYTASPVVYRGALWLITGDSVHGGGLWRSDGTEAGTSRVADLAAIESYELTAVGDRLFFAGYTDANGVQLWISDGTGPGTRPLSEPGVDVGKLTAVGDSLFFLGIDLEHGGELWKSDGTETGTGLVKDIWQGGGFDGWPAQLASVDGILLFTADDPEHGRELWRSDGTEGGTFLVQDLLPGREGSSPGALVRAGDRVFFSATDDAAGREPWVGRSSILTGQPMLALRDLADEVRGLGLPIGTERSLTAKLDAAGLALARRGGVGTATRLLAAFVQELQASSALIPPAVLADLLDFATDIEPLLTAIVAPPPPSQPACARRCLHR